MPTPAAPYSLRNLTVIAVAITSTALIVSSAAIWQLRLDTIADVERDSGNLATIFAEQTRQSVKIVDTALIELSDQLAVTYRTAPQSFSETIRSEQFHQHLVNISSRVARAGVVSVIDADGQVASTSQDWPAPGIDASNRDYFIAHRTANVGFNVSIPVVSRVTGEPTVILSRRIEAPGDVFLGVVLVGIPIRSFQHIYGSINTLTKQTFMFLRSDGTILVRYPDVKDRAGEKMPPQHPWHRIAAQGGGFYRTPGIFDSEARLVAVRNVAEYPLTINVAASETAALAGWWQRTISIALATALILICLALLLRNAAKQEKELRRQEERLRLQNRRFKAAIDNMGEGLCMFDADDRLLVCNERFGSIYELPSDLLQAETSLQDITAHCIKSGVLTDGIGDFAVLERNEAQNQEARATPTHRVAQFADGRLMRITRYPLDTGGWVATHEDVTDRQRHEARISFMAHHDLLTGLANRTFFTEQLSEATARLRRNGEAFAVFMLDLDRFKNVNDTLGHSAGDQLLRETAQRLKMSLRESDVLARLGGDEFAIVQTSQTDPRDDASSLAQRVVDLISNPYDIGGNVVTIGTSIGIALAPEHAVDSAEMLKMADMALYAAKSAGRNDFRFFDVAMLTESNNRRQLEQELRVAILRREFELHYQPLVDVKTRRQAGFEALVRWRHPDRGLIMPDKFVVLAEETGLIAPLGAWILQRACADAANWPPHLKVAVNLSPVQLAHADLLPTILRALADSALPADRLELEITETALIKGDIDCVTLIRKIKKLGISIALDDFGTGYSSLSYLTMFPFDKIKIDRSFTSNLPQRQDCAAIVSAVLALGRGLDTETVAEGVETEEQFAILRAAGVTFVQGELFGRPRALADLVMDDAGAARKVGSAA